MRIYNFRDCKYVLHKSFRNLLLYNQLRQFSCV